MTTKVKAVCENCYMIFEMSSNAKLRLCPACKAEEQKRKKREAQHKRYYEKLRKKPAYTIGEVLRMAQEAQVSYGEMVEKIERNEKNGKENQGNH